jgi:pilus assembly protein CpaC
MHMLYRVSLFAAAWLLPLVASAQSDARPPARLQTSRAAAQGISYHQSKPLTITVGEITMLPIQGKIVRLALGSGDILSTTTVDANLLLIAEQVGTTSLLVWTKTAVHSYRVHVVPKDLAETRAKVDLLTRDMKGVTVDLLGNEIVLSGVAHRDALARLGAGLRGVPGVVLNVKEDQGSAFTRSVLFRLHFIEVKRSLLETIGINWAKSANGPVAGYIGIASDKGLYDPPAQIGSGANLLDPIPPFVARGATKGGHFLGLATTLSSRLNLGISSGDVNVLASPELTARSGGKARLQVGGEVPIPLAGAFGSTTVEFKPYGIILQIEPQIDADGIITAKISTELSQIDPAVTVAGIPGFLTRNTDTEVSLKEGEMVALSGLVNSEMSNAIDRVPAISRIPILGRLFRSDDFRNSRSELVVLLEPEIIAPGDGLALQLRDRGMAGKKQFEDKLLEQQKKELPVVTPDAALDSDRN